MHHSRRSVFAARLGGVLLLSSALAACGDDDTSTPDTGGSLQPDTGFSDAGDVGFDSGDDAGFDASEDVSDVGVDADDAGADTAGDTGADTTDTTPDAAADTTPDAAGDTTPDTTEDTTPDATEDTDTDVEPGPLAIVGTYEDDFGSFVRLSDEGVAYSWYGELAIAITRYDNDAGFFVGQNASDDPWSANLWSRVDWVDAGGGSLYWCQTAFAEADEAAALAVTPADGSDLDAGCGGFAWSLLSPGEGPLSMVGTYDDDFGRFVGVTNETVRFSWYSNAGVALTQYDNFNEWAVGQNSPADPWSANLWSKFEWAQTEDGNFAWCQTVFDAATEGDAVDAPGADREDLAAGCNGFSWSVLTPGQGPIAIGGEWVDSYGGRHSVRATEWVINSEWTFTFSMYDNAAEFVVAQNGAGNEYNPELWSRFDWAYIAGEFYYCQTVYDGADEAAALEAAPADRSDLDAGCGGFGWSGLSVAPID